MVKCCRELENILEHSMFLVYHHRFCSICLHDLMACNNNCNCNYTKESHKHSFISYNFYKHKIYKLRLKRCSIKSTFLVSLFIIKVQVSIFFKFKQFMFLMSHTVCLKFRIFKIRNILFFDT